MTSEKRTAFVVMQHRAAINCHHFDCRVIYNRLVSAHARTRASEHIHIKQTLKGNHGRDQRATHPSNPSTKQQEEKWEDLARSSLLRCAWALLKHSAHCKYTHTRTTCRPASRSQRKCALASQCAEWTFYVQSVVHERGELWTERCAVLSNQ